jgi:acetylornithine aminotransferase
MTDPQEALRRLIETDVLGPRLRDQDAVLALSVKEPLPVARADLLYLWDEYRTEFLDFAMTVSPLGHRHPPIIGTLIEHMNHYGFTAPQGQHVLRWPVQYAKDISDSFSGPSEARKVLFCEGSNEAVRQAVLLACHRTERTEVAALDTGNHDWLPGIHQFPHDAWNRIDWDRYGALLMSPVDSSYRPVPAAREWMMSARTAGVPVVVDETVTGFGRTGLLWGQEHIGLVAEMTVLGGPLGGGLPLGAVVGLPEFFADAAILSRTGPLAGHSWSCAAGQITLSAIHAGVLEHVIESAGVLSQALDGLQGQFSDQIAGHHGIGLLRGLRFRDPDRATELPLVARAHGLHLAPAVGDTVLLAPALVSSTHEVTRGVDLIAAVLMSWEDN